MTRRALTREQSLPWPPLLEVYQVAYRLGRSPESVRRLIRDGKLAAIRLGAHYRIAPADLQAFEEAQRCGCGPW